MAVNSQSGVFGFKRQVSSGGEAKGPYNIVNTSATSSLVVNDTVQRIKFTNGSSIDKFKLQITDSVGNVKTSDEITFNTTVATLATAIQTAINDSDFLGASACAAVADTDDIVVTFSGSGFDQVTVPLLVPVVTEDANGTFEIEVTADKTPGAWYWLPALNVAFQPNQMVQAIPPEVGGSLWSRGSYKGGVYGGGNVTMIPRAGLGVAEMLYALCGGGIKETVTVSGGDTDWGDYKDGVYYNKLKGTKTYDATGAVDQAGNGFSQGMFRYKFRPDRIIGNELPWYTFVRNVGGKFIEIFPDGHVGSLSFDMAASNLLQIDASFTSKSCATVEKNYGDPKVANPSATSDPKQAVGAQIAGNGSPFQMVDALVKLDRNFAGTPGAVAEYAPYNPTRLNIAFNNELTQNEFVVGSHFLQDITNLSRTAQITYSVYLRDADLYSRVYNHGYAAVNGRTSWSSEVWKGALEVTLYGGLIQPNKKGATEKYMLKINIPEMDYMAAPISLAGNNLVEFQLTANVVLSESFDSSSDTSLAASTTKWPFEIEYWTDEDIYETY